MYNDWLLSAKKDELIKVVQDMIKGRMSLVLVGSELEKIPSFKELEQVFEQA